MREAALTTTFGNRSAPTRTRSLLTGAVGRSSRIRPPFIQPVAQRRQGTEPGDVDERQGRRVHAQVAPLSHHRRELSIELPSGCQIELTHQAIPVIAIPRDLEGHRVHPRVEPTSER